MALFKSSKELKRILQETQAGFQNYQKQVNNTIATRNALFMRDYIKDLLEIQDILLQMEDEDYEGVEHLKKYMVVLLQKYEVEKIVVGDYFDPSEQEALLVIHSQTDTVTEMRAGYRMQGKVIRPALVKVEVTNE